MRRLKPGSLSSRSVDRLDRQQRHQPDQRAHLQLLDVAVRKVQHVVEELVLLVPQRNAHAADVVERLGDIQEVLEELGRHVLVGRIFARQLQGDRQHVQAIHAHPGGAVGLVEMAAGGQGRAAVEDADVVQAQEAALEDVAALGVFAVHPPGEVEQQFVEDAFQEAAVGDAGDLAVDLEHPPGAQACTGGLTSPKAHS